MITEDSTKQIENQKHFIKKKNEKTLKDYQVENQKFLVNFDKQFNNIISTFEINKKIAQKTKQINNLVDKYCDLSIKIAKKNYNFYNFFCSPVLNDIAILLKKPHFDKKRSNKTRILKSYYTKLVECEKKMNYEVWFIKTLKLPKENPFDKYINAKIFFDGKHNSKFDKMKAYDKKNKAIK